MKLIDADALANRIYEKWGINPKYEDDSLDAMMDVRCLELIDSAPTIEPKQGEWIIEQEFGFLKDRIMRCSVCGDYIRDTGITVNCGRGNWNYCPNCGAKMNNSEKSNNCEQTDRTKRIEKPCPKSCDVEVCEFAGHEHFCPIWQTERGE